MFLRKSQKLTLITIIAALTLACLAPASLASSESPADPPPAKRAVRSASAPTQTPERCARVTADSLHVRYQADYTAPIMGWFTQNTILKIKDDSSLWWKTYGPGIDAWGRDANMTGFVKAEYLEITPCTQ